MSNEQKTHYGAVEKELLDAIKDENMRPIKKIAEETLVLLAYNSPEPHRDHLKAFINEFADDRVAMNTLHHFYSFLPDAREDGIRELREVARKNGVFLLCAITFSDNYLYLVTMENVELLGPLQQGIEPTEVLNFFGFPDNDGFRKKYPTVEQMKLYRPVVADATLCPVCGTGNDELHTPGCPVEICPWCAGQLTRCDCRFKHSDRASLERDRHLDEFLELLEKKGRVPYDAAKHRPSF